MYSWSAVGVSVALAVVADIIVKKIYYENKKSVTKIEHSIF